MVSHTFAIVITNDFKGLGFGMGRALMGVQEDRKMAFPKYIAWLNSTSVAVGTKAQVERKAREIAHSELWLEHQRGPTTLRITTYGAQKFVSSVVLNNCAVID